jgi:hypothetical protein
MNKARSAGVLLAILFAAGCGGGEQTLMDRLPQGYDMYLTIHPERVGAADLLEIAGRDLPAGSSEGLPAPFHGMDPFDWSQWVETLGLEDGEIGMVGLGEDTEFLAFFLPCGNGERIRSLAREAGDGETRFFTMDEYTVMVISWRDQAQLDSFEAALAGNPLENHGDYIAMRERLESGSQSISFMFSSEVTEVPVLGRVIETPADTRFSIAVLGDLSQVDEYSGAIGDGLQSGNIRFPRETMSAVRMTADMVWLADSYQELSQGSGDMAEIEAGLPFIGFSSMEEFLNIFQGDFCVALTGVEFDRHGDPSGGAGLVAVSLTDSEKLEQSLSMISMMADATRESNAGLTSYRVSDGGDSFRFFILDSVLYITLNVTADQVQSGVPAADFLGRVASNGFLAGAADAEMLVRGIRSEAIGEDILLGLFSGTPSFSVDFRAGIFTCNIAAGADAIRSIVLLALRGE